MLRNRNITLDDKVFFKVVSGCPQGMSTRLMESGC